MVGLGLRCSIMVALCGLGVGLVLAWMGGRAVSAQLFGITAHDIRVMGLAAAALLVVSAIAAWFPARRAATIDPVVALRVVE